MKICYIANLDNIHTQRWVKYFTDLGHEVQIITDGSIEKFDNAKVHKIRNMGNVNNIGSFFLNLLINVIRVNRLVNNFNPEILHAHSVLYYGFYGIFSFFRPFIISAWGSDVLRAPTESIIPKYIVPYSLKKADKILTTSPSLVDFLIDKFNLMPKKVIRIPWGTNTNIFHKKFTYEEEELKEKLKIPINETVILSNRHLAPHYNIEKIIEAISPVLKFHPETTFIFLRGYGTLEFEERMKVKAEELGVINNVRFISKSLTEKEMANYLNISDIFISLTKTDQFASSIMEGMSCGVIPILSDIEVYHYYLTNQINTLFVDPDNPVDISKKICYCIENPEIKENFYKINKEIITKHEDWDKNALKMLKLYNDLKKRNF